jgi:hypothetical protein
LQRLLARFPGGSGGPAAGPGAGASGGPEPTGPANPPGPGGGTPTNPPKPAGKPESSPLEQWQEKAADWFKDNLDGLVESLDGWIDSPTGRSWRDALGRALGRESKVVSAGSELTRRATGLARHLPRPGDYLPRRLGEVLRGARVPSLPRVRASLPSVGLPSGGPSGRQTGVGLVWLAVLAACALLLWKTGAWYQQHRAALAGQGWRLGPWPVAPDRVATRAELVRAFEYLALLLLGPAARARHHLDLGEQIGAQPDMDPERRQQAAEHLARLYEQARYAPADEPLPPADLAAARRELCYLAGVAAT